MQRTWIQVLWLVSTLLPAPVLFATTNLPPALQREATSLLDVHMDLMMVADTGTDTIESLDELMVPGEPARLHKTYTLGLGSGRAALVRVEMSWIPRDRREDGLLIDVESRAVLTSAVGWSSTEVGEVHTRRQPIFAVPGQAHLYELWVSRDLRTRFLASFQWDPADAAPANPLAESTLETVTFRVRAHEGEGWRRDMVQEADLRSIGGKEVGFRFRDEEPVEVQVDEDVDDDPSGLTRRAGDSDWMARNLSKPYKIPKAKAQAKRREELRERMEKGELTREDLAILEKERKAGSRRAYRVERAEMKLTPVYTGSMILRMRVVIDAELRYPDLGLEAVVDVDRVVDLERADRITFDLLEMAGAQPEEFPHRYVFEVQAFW